MNFGTKLRFLRLKNQFFFWIRNSYLFYKKKNSQFVAYYVTFSSSNPKKKLVQLFS